MSLDLTLSPLYRIDSQEPDGLPGLLAVMPPRKTARGREQDRLVLYLLLAGNASFSSAEYKQLVEDAAAQFYKSPGPLTSALRTAAGVVNTALVERNMSTSARGQYAVGWLTLAVLREGATTQCTFLLSGPMHVFLLGSDARHVHEPGLSGKGLGVSNTSPHYFTQTTLQVNDRILLTGKVPAAWESTLAENSPASLEATRRRLLTLTGEDLNAVLFQVTPGPGALRMVRTPAIDELEPDAPPQTDLDVVPVAEAGPSPSAAYAIAAPLHPSTDGEGNARPTKTANDFPASIPRAKSKAATPEPLITEQSAPAEPVTITTAATPASRAVPSARTRQPGGVVPPVRGAKGATGMTPAAHAAKAVVGGMQAWRRGTDRMNQSLQRFLPRLLPGNESGEALALPPYVMTFIALLIPLIVVTVASVVYLRYGRSVQYENYLQQAQNARGQAVSLSDPVMQRDAWQSVLLYVERAESYRETGETTALRHEAESHLDALLGIARLQFTPAFSNRLGIEISRMAATESDLYLLDART
ncbi:MAG TPA: hypothetical protein VGJ22_11130, partial [Anaerolineales bacterium]